MAPPEPPSPTTTATLGDADTQADVDRMRDRLGLAALLGIDAGKGAGGVDERDDGQVEPVGELHQPRRLAIALGPRHPEIMLDAALGVRPLLLAHEADRAPAEAPEAADDRLVLAEHAVSGQRREVGDERFRVVGEMRALRVARDLRLLPRREGRVEVGERLGRPRLQPHHLLADGRRVAVEVQGPELVHLGVDVGDGLFEVEVVAHAL